MTKDVKIAVVGAGLVGKCHIDSLDITKGSTLDCIVDPSDAGRQIAIGQGVKWYPTIEEMFAQSKPDGVILATPNQHHLSGALICMEKFLRKARIHE